MKNELKDIESRIHDARRQVEFVLGKINSGIHLDEVDLLQIWNFLKLANDDVTSLYTKFKSGEFFVDEKNNIIDFPKKK